MRYKEGPWWVPLAILGAFIAAIVTMPATTGKAAHAVIHGGVTAIQSTAGSSTDDLPPVLPSPTDGPPVEYLRSND